MIRTRIRRAAGQGVLLVLLGAALPAAVADAQTTMGTFEASVPIEATRGDGFAINRIVVQAEEPGSVRMTFDDVLLTNDGAWGRVEFGSTPYTLKSHVHPLTRELRYAGDMVGRRETFEVELRVTGIGDESRAGLVTYTFVPDSDPAVAGTPAVRQAVAVRVRIGAWPADLEGIPAAVEVTELRLSRDREELSGFFDRLIPDIPGIVNRGPAILSARTTNVGDALVQSETTLHLARLPWIAAVPFVRPAGSTVITYVDRPRLLLPTESALSSVLSTASLVEGDEVDRLPFFGLVRITADATAYLGASRDETQESRTYLVAPWKEALVAALLYRAVAIARRRSAGRREQRAEDHRGVVPTRPAAATHAEAGLHSPAGDDGTRRRITHGAEAPGLKGPSLVGFDDLQARLAEIRSSMGDQISGH